MNMECVWATHRLFYNLEFGPRINIINAWSTKDKRRFQLRLKCYSVACRKTSNYLRVEFIANSPIMKDRIIIYYTFRHDKGLQLDHM